MRLLICLAALCLPLAAGDTVVLANGAQLRADRVEREGNRLILHDREGRIEIDASTVEEIIPDPAFPPPREEKKLEPVPFSKPARELLTEAALRYGLPPEIVHSVAAVESAYRQDVISPKGAIGVMQLMPGTARELNANPHDLEENIDAGVRLLRRLLERFQHEPNPVRRALAAYNAGEGAVRRYNGIPPYRETRHYVEKVVETYWRLAGPHR